MVLHHDSHEAYLCDVLKSLRRKTSAATGAYDANCEAQDGEIARAVGFEWPQAGSEERAEIKRAERKAPAMYAANQRRP